MYNICRNSLNNMMMFDQQNFWRFSFHAINVSNWPIALATSYPAGLLVRLIGHLNCVYHPLQKTSHTARVHDCRRRFRSVARQTRFQGSSCLRNRGEQGLAELGAARAPCTG